jgi:hypothetical protein
LKDAIDEFERGGILRFLFERKRVLRPLTVVPVVRAPKVRPTFVPFLGAMLFVHKDNELRSDVEILKSTIVTDVRIEGWGNYYALHCQSIERRFHRCLDFRRSTFELVRRSTLTLSPSSPWVVLDQINSVSSLPELKSRQRRPQLEVLVPATAQLKKRWAGSFLVFDRQVYFSSEVLQRAPDLLATEAKCDLRQPLN